MRGKRASVRPAANLAVPVPYPSRTVRRSKGQHGNNNKDFSAAPLDAWGAPVDFAEVVGVELALHTQHDVQIFFIGIGADANLDVGRVLAQATGAEFQGVAEEDLATVLEEFSKYF